MAIPVVEATFGIPVSQSDVGAPAILSENGIGIPVRIVESGGMPLSIQNQVITADVAPTLAALTDDETPADGLNATCANTSNYSSTAGTISSVVITVFIDAVAQTDDETDQDLDEGEAVQVRYRVTDSEDNVRDFHTATRTVSYAAAATVANAIADVEEETGTLVQIDLTNVFSRATGSYAVSGLSVAYSIDSETDALSFTIAADQDDTVVVTYTDSGGSVPDTFAVTEAEAVPGVAPEILDYPDADDEDAWTYNPGAGSDLTFRVSVDSVQESETTFPPMGANEARVQLAPQFSYPDGGTEPGDTVVASLAHTHDTLGADFAVNYRWLLGGSPIGNTTLTATYTDTDETLQLGVTGIKVSTGETVMAEELFAPTQVSLPAIVPDVNDDAIAILLSTTRGFNVFDNENADTVETEGWFVNAEPTVEAGTLTLNSWDANGDYDVTSAGSAGSATLQFVIESSTGDTATKDVVFTQSTGVLAGLGLTQAEDMTYDSHLFPTDFLDSGTPVVALQNSPDDTSGEAFVIWNGGTKTVKIVSRVRDDTDAENSTIGIYVNDALVDTIIFPAAANAFYNHTTNDVDLEDDDKVAWILDAQKADNGGLCWTPFEYTIISVVDAGELVPGQINAWLGASGSQLPATPTAGNLIALFGAERGNLAGATTGASSGFTIHFDASSGVDATDKVGLLGATKVSDGTEADKYLFYEPPSNPKSGLIMELSSDGGGTFSIVDPKGALQPSANGSATIAFDSGDTDPCWAWVVVSNWNSNRIGAYNVTSGWTNHGKIGGAATAPGFVVFSKYLASGGTTSMTFTATDGDAINDKFTAGGFLVRAT